MTNIVFSEPFDGTVAPDGWPAGWTVSTWSASGGSEYQVTGGYGAVTLFEGAALGQPGTFIAHKALGFDGNKDHKVRIRFAVGTATNTTWGFSIINGVGVSWALSTEKVTVTAPGASAQFDLAESFFTGASGDIGLFWRWEDGVMRVRIWDTDDPEPSTWDAEVTSPGGLVTGTDVYVNFGGRQEDTTASSLFVDSITFTALTNCADCRPFAPHCNLLGHAIHAIDDRDIAQSSFLGISPAYFDVSFVPGVSVRKPDLSALPDNEGGVVIATRFIAAGETTDVQYANVAGTWSATYSLMGDDLPDNLPASFAKLGAYVRWRIDTAHSFISVQATRYTDAAPPLGDDDGNDKVEISANGTVTGEGVFTYPGRLPETGAITIHIGSDGSCLVRVGTESYELTPAGMAPDVVGFALEAFVTYDGDDDPDDDGRPYEQRAAISAIGFVADDGSANGWCGTPRRNQPIQDEFVAEGDDSTTGFSTRFPYTPLSLEVEVDGISVGADEAEPSSGAFTLSFAPDTGERITASYRYGGFA